MLKDICSSIIENTTKFRNRALENKSSATSYFYSFIIKNECQSVSVIKPCALTSLRKKYYDGTMVSSDKAMGL